MGLKRSVAAAVGDSSLASLATFAVGLYAARQLSLTELGGYGILFVAAFVLGGTTVTQLYFTPLEVAVVERPPTAQLATISRTLATGLVLASGIAVVVIAAALLAVPDLGWSARLQLGAGAAALAALSPTQDHVRRMLHQCGRSPAATQVSAVQLVVAATVLGALWASDVPHLVIPFTALAAANAASLVAGLLLARRGRTHHTPAEVPPLRGLLRLGGWLVLSTQADQVAGFVGIVVLGALAGASSVGEYEAARQLAQPLFVLSGALISVLRPRVMAAAQHADAHAARRTTTTYVALLGAAGIGYAVVAGTRWPGNPLVGWFPNAYASNWLLATLVVATAAAFVQPIFGIQAIAARREKDLVRISMTNQFVYVGAVAALSGPLGAVAMPVASLLNTATWLARFRGVLRRIYRPSAPAPEPAPVRSGAGPVVLHAAVERSD